jgi:catechol 2,3-dioxygenase-like lactoylglutathione lyase family enzyme
MTSGIVLYVDDLALSAAFYQEVLQLVPRWTEAGGAMFDLPDGTRLGLRSEASALQQLGDELPDPRVANGTPRGEVRLDVIGVPAFLARALNYGARSLAEPALGLDGRLSASALDLDGHALVFLELATEAQPSWFARLHAALGPIAAGLVLDFFDLLTPGPVGYVVGPIVGLIVGGYLAGFHGFKGMSRLALALLAAAYLAAPMTGFLPLATLIGALARFGQSKPRPLGS